VGVWGGFMRVDGSGCLTRVDGGLILLELSVY